MASRFVRRYPALSLAFIVAVAAILRFDVIAFFPNFNHPDENFQLFEQGHRLAFGYGIVPWEFVDGIRSLVLPALIAGIFKLSEPVFGGPEGYLLAARSFFVVLTLPAIAAVFHAGLRQSPRHALSGAFTMAIWYELVYFAGKPLTEAVAADFLIPALALASPGREHLSTRRTIAIGLLLATAALLRIQILPGVGVAAAYICRTQFRTRWLPMTIGALPALALFGASDWIAWGSPFHSYLANVDANLVNDKASTYGVQPWDAYIHYLRGNWGPPGAVIILAGLAYSVRRFPLFLVTGLVIIAVHMAIPHKEYRFIVPAIACLIAGAGLGLPDLVHRLAGSRRPEPVAAFAGLLWIGISLYQATLGPYNPAFFWFGTDRAMMALARRPEVCGIFFDFGVGWGSSGGYAHLHRKIPLYDPYIDHWSPQDVRRYQASFNAILALSAPEGALAGYHQDTCYDNRLDQPLCLYTRPGGCSLQTGAVQLLDVPRLGENKRPE